MVSLTRRISKKEYNILWHIISIKDVITGTIIITAGYIIMLLTFYFMVWAKNN